MPKILVCDPLADAGLEILRQVGDVVVGTDLDANGLLTAVADVDAIVVRSGTEISAPIIEAAPQLSVIARAGVGVDNIDVSAATRCGVLVVNSPLGNTLAATEHTLGLMLAAARRIPQAAATLKAGAWDRKSFVGRQLFEKTIGLVGLGKVGSEVARRAAAFGMTVIAHDPYVTQQQADAVGAELVSGIDELAAQADFVSLHCALTPDTQGMIDQRVLAMMKRDSVLINCARGGLVDEDDLLAALLDGQIGGAALDVFAREPTPNEELLNLDNVIATPHVGASTEEAQDAVAVDAARQVKDVLEGRLPRYPVNARPLSADAQAAVAPYLGLVNSLGILVHTLGDGLPERVELASTAELAAEHMHYLQGHLIAAVLGGIVEETLNFVNAPIVAGERGIELAQSKIEAGWGYSHMLEVRATTADGTLDLAGAVLGDSDYRIVRIDGFRLEFVPRQHVLLIYNNRSEEPGFIGQFGALLADAGISITGIQCSPDIVDDIGLMAARLGSAIDAPVRDQIQQLPGVVRVDVFEFNCDVVPLEIP
jgi:D-3-phosphoglycerate dehydrogenase